MEVGMKSTDDLVLGLLAAGRLRVGPDGEVWAMDYRGKWWLKRESRKAGSGRVRFQFEVGGRKTTVYKSRLLYLVLHGTAPEVVDHGDGDRTNNDQANLKPHTRAESDRQGREAQRRKVTKNAEDFFDYIAFHGHEPPDHLNVPEVIW